MKPIPAVLAFLFISFKLFSQDYTGLGWAPYAGVQNIAFNPAIADSRFKVDVNLVSTSYTSHFKGLLWSSSLGTAPINLLSRFDTVTTIAQKEGLFLRESWQILGPSVLYAFGKNRNNRYAVAFTSSLCGSLRMSDASGDAFYKVVLYDSIPVNKMEHVDADFFFASWAEYVATFGMVVLNQKSNLLKLGVSGNMMIPNSVVDFSAGSLQGQGFDENRNINIGQLDYFRSTPQSNLTTSCINLRKSGEPAFRGSIGAIYEFRPHWRDYEYEMDGRRWPHNEPAKHLLAVGVSYTHSAELKYSGFAVENDSLNFAVGSRAVTSLGDFENKLGVDPTSTGVSKAYVIPAAFKAFVDANFYKGLGLNLNYTYSIPGDESANNVQMPSTFIGTLKYEEPRIGAYIPFTMKTYDGDGDDLYMLGIGVRFEFLYVGYNHALGASGKQINVGLKVPIRYNKQKDSDHDKVSDKHDACLSQQGWWGSLGCPDADSDSIPDKDEDPDCITSAGLRILCGCPDTDGDNVVDPRDSCVTEFGLFQFDGCPDFDRDSVPDRFDVCREDPGPVFFNGCPDSDNDSIPDIYDSCKDAAGIKKFQGCPDRDGDDIIDSEDYCPDEKGNVSGHGCPDADIDGITDDQDECPHRKGNSQNCGCPFEDDDGDRVPNCKDQCPNEIGSIDYDGCPPPLDSDDLREHLHSRVKFSEGLNVYRSSLEKLDKIKEIMIKYPEQDKLVIKAYEHVGDTVASPDMLEKRCQVVADYLTMNLGIPAEKISYNICLAENSDCIARAAKLDPNIIEVWFTWHKGDE